jgi:hypothetical protein
MYQVGSFGSGRWDAIDHWLSVTTNTCCGSRAQVVRCNGVAAKAVIHR